MKTGETFPSFFNLEKMLKLDISKEKKKHNHSSFEENSIIDDDNENENSSILEENENQSLKAFKIQIDQEKNVLPLSEEEIRSIKSSLKNNFLFSDLSKQVVEQIVSNLVVLCINAGDNLYKEYDEGYFFFIVKKGKFESSSSSSDHIITLIQGDTFGEDALLNMSTRTTTVKCIEEGELYPLDAKVFRNTVYTINRLNYKERIHFLKLIPMFRWIDDNELNNVSDCLIKCDYSDKRIITRKGTKGESIFIVIEGIIDLVQDDDVISSYGPQEYVGECYALFNETWPCDLITRTRVKCYQLLKSDMIRYIGDDFYKKFIFAICKEAISKTQVFKFLLGNVDNIFYKFVEFFAMKKYEKENEIVIDKSLPPNKIVIIFCGKVYFDNNKNKKIGSRGEMLIEDNLLNNTPLTHNIIKGKQTVITIEATLDEVTSIISQSINKSNTTLTNNIIDLATLLDFYERISHLKKIQIFKNISDTKLLEIGKLMIKKKYKKGEVIIQENTEGQYLFFLYKGKVHILNNKGKKIREYQDCVCFGEISLLTHKPHTATVVAVEEAYTYLLAKKDFEEILDNNMMTYLTNKINLMDNTFLVLNDLYYVAKLGEGKFGHVSLVHDCKNIYAIKAVNKLLAQRKKMLTKYFIKERNILLSIDYPFIIKLVKTFQNQDYVFYLMEYVKGSEMSSFLNSRKEKDFRNKFQTQFYIASVLLIINYLHGKKIAHRDIKAENIMLDENGYIKLIDFNTCVEIQDLTATIAGTPHYMAPELLLGKGYTFSVDYWSIGILAYKIYYGYFPFGNGMYDPMDIYHDIIEKDLLIPYNSKDSFSAFVVKLLNKQPRERLCNFEQIKLEDFFYGFNWDELVDMKMIAPYEPEVKFDLEECLMNKRQKYVDMIKTLEMQSFSMSTLKDLSRSNINNLTNKEWAQDF